jgi:hypothetical protein
MGGADHLAAELEFTARQLRQAGELGLRRELQAAITSATRDIPAEIRAGLMPRLPDPYAAVFDADLQITVSKRYGSKDPGVTVRATSRGTKRRALYAVDRGKLRHPVFGNRLRWVLQEVVPGWFSDPVRAARDRARGEIQSAMDRVAAEALKKGSL